MNIVTWNINGLKSAYEKGDFKNLLEKNIDIICLQEIKISDEKYIKDIIPNSYNVYINKAEKNGYSGVAVLSRKKAKSEVYEIGHERFDKEGRCIILEFEDFLLYNLYIPHGGRDKKNLQYKIEVCNHIIANLKERLLTNRNVIITTDFNIAHNEIDLARPKQNRKNIMFTEIERKIVDEMIEIGMIDSFREITKESDNYTWWPYAFNARERNLGWRIDYIFLSDKLSENIIKVEMLKNIFGSDHCPTEIFLNLD